MTSNTGLIRALLTLRSLSGAERQSLEAMSWLSPDLNAPQIDRLHEIEGNHRAELQDAR